MINDEDKLYDLHDNFMQTIRKIHTDALIDFFKRALKEHGFEFDSNEELKEFMIENVEVMISSNDNYDLNTMVLKSDKRGICSWRNDFNIVRNSEFEFSGKIWEGNISKYGNP